MQEFPASDARVLRAAGITDSGNRRKLNEDYFLIRRRLGLFVVADGVGGKNAGEVASALTAHAIWDFFEVTANVPDAWPEEFRTLLDLALAPPAKRLCAAIRKANSDVFAMANAHEDHKNMNSTVVAAHAVPGSYELHLAHVGDSRCYRIQGGAIEQLTRDHSLRNETRVSNPELTEKQLARIPENVITRAIGNKEHVELDVQAVRARPGDLFLLCSDGVNREISDQDIVLAMEVSETPEEAVENIVGLAKANKGRDNIAAVVLQFG